MIQACKQLSSIDKTSQLKKISEDRIKSIANRVANDANVGCEHCKEIFAEAWRAAKQ